MSAPGWMSEAGLGLDDLGRDPGTAGSACTCAVGSACTCAAGFVYTCVARRVHLGARGPSPASPC